MTAARKRWLIYVAVAGCLILLAAFAVRAHFREPVYQGKTVTEWLQTRAPTKVSGIKMTNYVIVTPSGNVTIATAIPVTSANLLAGYPLGSRVAFTNVSTYEVVRSDPSLEALLAMGTNAMPALIRILDQQDSFLSARYAALYSQTSFRWRRILPEPSSSTAQLRQHAAEVIVRIQPQGGPYLAKFIDLLADRSPGVRHVACAGILRVGKLPPAEMKHLEEMIATRIPAQEALDLVRGLHMSDSFAVSVYSNALQDRVCRVTALKLIAARPYPPKEVLPGVVRVLSDPDPATRQTASRLLEKMGPDARSAVPELIKLMEDSNDETRYLAVRALDAIGSASRPAVPALQNALHDSNPMVVTVADRLLKTLAKENPDQPSPNSGR